VIAALAEKLIDEPERCPMPESKTILDAASETLTHFPDLPSEDALALADYKLGSFMSDLDSVAQTLRRQTPEIETMADLDAYGKAGFPKPALGRGTLARIAVFAEETIHDAEQIREWADEIKRLAVVLHRQGGDGDAAAAELSWAAAEHWTRTELEWLEHRHERNAGTRSD
jgi:ABC-type transporter Mla subunit MlaD